MKSEILTQKKLDHGDVLFHEGEAAERIYIIHSGELEILKKGPDGLHDIVRTAKTGEVAGEIALSSGRVYECGARANGSSNVVVIERRKLLKLLQTEDRFVSALFRILAQNLLSVMDHKSEAELLKAEVELESLAETDDPEEPSE